MGDSWLQEVIRPELPVCVILGVVLHYMTAAQGREAVAGYVRLIAPGSCVVISTGRCDDPAPFTTIKAAYTPARQHNHSRAQVASFFAGLDLVPPGVKPAAGLRPGWGDAPGAPGRAYVLAGVAQKKLRPGASRSSASRWPSRSLALHRVIMDR
jgi:S-adenosyl methyltransferase